MIDYKEFKSLSEKTVESQQYSTADLIEMLRSRQGVTANFVDYGEFTRTETTGPKVLITIDVLTTDDD